MNRTNTAIDHHSEEAPTGAVRNPATQVLVCNWDGASKFVMPRGDLYDKVDPNNIKEVPVPWRGSPVWKDVPIKLPRLIRVQRIFGRFEHLYVVAAS